MKKSELRQKPNDFEFDPDMLELTKPPFFIVGCVRSGTTILRDMLRLHPRMECPEETHFYRWADPYGSPRFKSLYNGTLFQEHRKLDNVADIQFSIWTKISANRKQLSAVYGNKYIEVNGGDPKEVRLFDKTPQNVYGMLLICADFPDAKFVHIYRNPLNVVTSLMEGKVMAKHSMLASVNYWSETMKILGEFKKFYPDRLIEIPYEEVMCDPDHYVKQVSGFVGEDESLIPALKKYTHPEKNKYKKALSRSDIDFIVENCEPFYSQYGY